MGAWQWSGIARESLENISAIKISNSISLWVVCALFMQLPVILNYWYVAGLPALVSISAGILGMLAVPVLNRFNHFFVARTVLITTYWAYVCAAALIWHIDVHIQYFLLLGIFVSPFLFYQWEHKQAWLFMGLFTLSFISLELYWIPGSTTFDINQGEALHPAQKSNTFFLALSVLISCQYIRHNTSVSWLKLQKESRDSNQLLHNMLPGDIVKELKLSDNKVAKYHSQVSIIFADLHGFSSLCQTRSAQEVVVLLDAFYSLFDSILTPFNLEKIKTIGDEYMAVAGLNGTTQSHALEACLYALSIRQSFAEFCQKNKLSTGLRIGIATGEIIAGVIGKTKFSYDVWGNTVNLASRMQSQGIPGEIQVCKTTYDLVCQHFEFTPRGDILVKGMGTMPTYWLQDEKHHVQIREL